MNNNKASSLKSSIENFIRRQGIEVEMEQNLVKEAIHLHLLSALSETAYFVTRSSRAERHCVSATAANATVKT